MRAHAAGRVALAVCLSAALGAAPRAGQAPAGGSTSCAVTTADRIVAVGDIHGAVDRLTQILTETGLIDGKRKWMGGHAVLVQTGDILDRGANSRQAIDLLRRLEGEAASAGGRVITLLGNHEAMRILGDNHDTSSGEYAAFKSADAEDLRERYYTFVMNDAVARARKANEKFDESAFRKAFMAKTPLGLVEMLVAFAADGDYGRWVRSRDTVAIVNGIAFVHGGFSPDIALLGCAAINDKVRAELGTVKLSDPNDTLKASLIAGPSGPLWFRGYVDPPLASDADVDSVLKALGAKAIVVGHTVATERTIQSRFGGKVVSIDTGMVGGEFFTGGVASALEIKDGAFTAVYQGRREVLRPR